MSKHTIGASKTTRMRLSLRGLMLRTRRQRARWFALCAVVPLACGCQTIGNLMNPFYESPPPEAYLGEKNDRALNATYEKAETARSALEHMATYRRANEPEPIHPVIQPAVVRLMWVPDHLNKSGDLVPPHYYYLKVLSDRWAVQDAFELESQLGPTNSGSNVPWTAGAR